MNDIMDQYVSSRTSIDSSTDNEYLPTIDCHLILNEFWGYKGYGICFKPLN